MNNETLSMKQADKIIDELNKIMVLCKNTIQQKDTDFIKKLSTIWEDKYAVDFIKAHGRTMDQLINDLNRNNNIFANVVKDITSAYAKAGGMSVAMTAEVVHLEISLPLETVKEYFADGNSDDFGFKDPDNGADQVLEAFGELKKALQNAGNNVIDQIKSINAFGNRKVQFNLAGVAGDIVKIVEHNVENNKILIKQCVEQTAQSYKKIGSNSESAAKIASN